MAAHDGAKHSEPQQSCLIEDPDFVELCRIAKRLPAEQRDKLTDMLWSDKLTRINEQLTADLNETIRMFDDAEKPFDVA